MLGRRLFAVKTDVHDTVLFRLATVTHMNAFKAGLDSRRNTCAVMVTRVLARIAELNRVITIQTSPCILANTVHPVVADFLVQSERSSIGVGGVGAISCRLKFGVTKTTRSFLVALQSTIIKTTRLTTGLGKDTLRKCGNEKDYHGQHVETAG